jgi:hypothetical protein
VKLSITHILMERPQAYKLLSRRIGCDSFERLGKRLCKLVELMGNAIGSTVPLACQDWANTKAAYRFFSNEGERGRDLGRPFRG